MNDIDAIEKVLEESSPSVEEISKYSEEYLEISEDLQRDILSLILTDRDFLITSLSIIKPEYFANSAHREICKICHSFFTDNNEPITQDILLQEIRNQFEHNDDYPRYLTEVDIISERSDLAFREKVYLSKKVIKFAQDQALTSAILKSVDLIHTDKHSEIEKMIREALLVAPNISLGLDIFENVSERYQRILAESEGERFTTGFPTIDNDLGGGTGRKEVGMIFANSGVGKSLWLQKVSIDNMIKGKNVLYLTCEMSELRVMERIDSMLSNLPVKDIKYKVPELKRRYEVMQPHLAGKRIKVKEFPAGEAKIADFRAYANQLYNHTGFKPDLVILDYIDEVAPSRSSGDNTYIDQYKTLREFRAWMTVENFAGFTATQANRQGRETKTITEGQMGDSYAKIRVVDACWSLNQSDEENNKLVARLYAVKHRNAKSKYTICVKFNPDTRKMYEITKAEYESIMGTEAVPTHVADEEDI